LRRFKKEYKRYADFGGSPEHIFKKQLDLDDKMPEMELYPDNWSTAEEHPDFVKNDPRKIAREILQMHDKRTTRKVTSLPRDRQTTKLPDELAAKLNLELSDDLLEYLQKIVAVVLCSALVKAIKDSGRAAAVYNYRYTPF